MTSTTSSSMLLAIECITYNQKTTILDALNGFVMQKTNFPYIIILIDDASTDGESEVINKYLKEHFNLSDTKISYTREDNDSYYTFAQHSDNKYCHIIYLQLKHNMFRNPRKRDLYAEWEKNVKYIALCEGDDYWIDDNKLQKQVNYLEKHENCSCFAHNSLTLNTETKQIGLFNKKLLQQHTYSLPEFISKTWFTPTQSLVFRKDSAEYFCPFGKFMHGDYNILVNLLLGHDSYIYYSNDIMSVYRQGGYASSNYRPDDLCNDFIDLLSYYKEHSSHRCDDLFDKLIEKERKELQLHTLYIEDEKKSRSLYIRFGFYLCRCIAKIFNKRVDCIKVTKTVDHPFIPNIEELS